MSKGVISKDEDYSQWFNDLIIKSDMAEYSPVRGCMIIKPYGYSIWEKIQAQCSIKCLKKQGTSKRLLSVAYTKILFLKRSQPCGRLR
jgi:prolyl-tRNA synthetase